MAAMAIGLQSHIQLMAEHRLCLAMCLLAWAVAQVRNQAPDAGSPDLECTSHGHKSSQCDLPPPSHTNLK